MFYSYLFPHNGSVLVLFVWHYSWWCHADDDTYFNIPNLIKLLKSYDSSQDWYIGRPSLNHPMTVNVNRVVSHQRFLVSKFNPLDNATS